MIPDSQLTKGEIRKLNAAKKMLGDSVGENAFAQWYATKPESVIKDDPIAQQIVQALDRFKNDKKFIFEAAAQASKAVKFIEALQPVALEQAA